MSLRIRLKETLANKDLTPYKLSQGTGISQTTIGRLLKEETNPNRSTIDIIARFLKVNTDWLMTGEGNQNEFVDKNHLMQEPSATYMSDDMVAEYIIENHDRLMQNKKFAIWIRSVQLEAQHEVLKRSMEK